MTPARSRPDPRRPHTDRLTRRAPTSASAGRLVLVLLTASTVTVMAAPGATPQSQTPTFKSTTSLVVVDVSVLDKDGRPVADLTADDFEVKLDGKVRPVRAVTFEQIPGPAATRAVAGTGNSGQSRTVTNAPQPTIERRVVVILIDDLSLSPSRGKSMLFAAGRFVKSLPDSDIVGFTTTSGDETLNPTFDHAAVEAGLRHVVGEFLDPRMLPGPPVSLEEAINIKKGDDLSLQQAIARDCFSGSTAQALSPTALTGSCADDVSRKERQVGDLAQMTEVRQFASYSAVVEAMKSSAGLKQLVLISDGLAMSHQADAGVSEYDALAKAAAASGVQVSVLNEEADGVSVADSDETNAGTFSSNRGGPINQGVMVANLRRTDNLFLRNGIENVAGLTGGAFYHVIGLADPVFARVALASSALYQLGVDPEGTMTAGRDFALAVKVKRNGLTVLANRHAVAPTAPTKVPVDVQVRQALSTGTPFYDVPLALGSAIRRGASANEVSVQLNVEIPGSVHGPLELSFVVGNQSFQKSGRTSLPSATAAGDYRASVAIPVPPGQYRVRFAVSDADGQVGSVQAAVAATLHKVGPLLTSDVLTVWAGSDNRPQFLALENVPATATNLATSLELYSPSAAPVPTDMTVLFELVNAADTTIARQPATFASANGGTQANAVFALQGVPVGAYTLRATVSRSGQTLGTVSTSLHLSGPASTR